MKFKYFLRGLGIGIIFSAVICLTAYLSNPESKISDEEIIRRAKTLGMIEQEDKVGDLLEKNISEDKNPSSSEKNGENTVSTEVSETITTENASVNSEEITEEEDSTKEKEKVSEKEKTETTARDTEEKMETTAKDTEEKTEQGDEKSTESEETVTITVERGASSYPICQKLEKLGMIKDASEFDTYLIENGYASKIRVGDHILKKGMSFHDIAEAISDQP